MRNKVVSNVAVVLDFKVLPQEPASSHFGIPFRQDPVFEDLLFELHRKGLTILRHYHPGNPPPAENILNQLNFDMDHCSAHFPFGSKPFFSSSCQWASTRSISRAFTDLLPSAPSIFAFTMTSRGTSLKFHTPGSS